MAPQPGKRSTRGSKQPGPHGRSAQADSLLVDPEAVAAVRRATAKTVHVLALTLGGGGRGVARGTSVAARWAWPRLKSLAGVVGRGLWRGLGASLRWLWDCRRGLTRVAHRGLWWGALAILVVVGRALLATDGNPEIVEVAMLWFGAGLSMSVLVLLGAPETRMRVAAFALASGHGSLAALTWIAIAGA